MHQYTWCYHCLTWDNFDLGLTGVGSCLQPLNLQFLVVWSLTEILLQMEGLAPKIVQSLARSLLALPVTGTLCWTVARVHCSIFLLFLGICLWGTLRTQTYLETGARHRYKQKAVRNWWSCRFSQGVQHHAHLSSDLFFVIKDVRIKLGSIQVALSYFERARFCGHKCPSDYDQRGIIIRLLFCK